MEDLPPLEGFPPDLSLDQKWDFLRPEITRLYQEQGHTLSQVREEIKIRFRFDANDNQYKYRQKVWKLRKNIPAAKKKAIIDKISSRRGGPSTSRVRWNGREVARQKLQRQARTDLRHSEVSFHHQGQRIQQCNLSAFAGKIFMAWNIPYKPSKAPPAQLVDHFSPFPMEGLTPSDISFEYPRDHNSESPYGPPSPLTSALMKKTSVERAAMFLKGNFQNIVAAMTHEEQLTMSTWLYQFWFFAFKTSKYWGRGPRHWTSDYLGFSQTEPLNFPTPASQSSPAAVASPMAQIQNPAAGGSGAGTALITPSQLCRWVVHVETTEYEAVPEPRHEVMRVFNVEDPNTYDDWSGATRNNSNYADTLRDALESNDFSSIQSEKLPLAVPQVLQSAVRVKGDLIAESLGFAIMSRNVAMLEDILSDSKNYESYNVYSGLEGLLSGINAFHLAAAYLDGAKSCCTILNLLNIAAPQRRCYVHSLGHTVLDALMITVIKCHTSCKPDSVSEAFRGTKRFPGEEVDICGRWDADSDCIKALLLRGTLRIPFHWKHKLCHTSTQAICDAIITNWGSTSAPNINTMSGLFIKHCSSCGMKMQLTPLHTLVIVMLQLSIRGCDGEDLFGMIAVLLCLLRYGADPLVKCAVAVAYYLQDDSASDRDHTLPGCQHQELDPLEFARAIFDCTTATSDQSIFDLPADTLVGWKVCLEILRYSQSREKYSRTESSDHGSCLGGGKYLCTESPADKICFGRQTHHWILMPQIPHLDTLWAAFRTELATYRRVCIGDSWNSRYIDLNAILLGLQENSAPNIPLIIENMMDTCRCGKLLPDDDECIRPVPTCKFYFSNMEDWHRSSFLLLPDRRWWEGWPVDDIEPASPAPEDIGNQAGPSNSKSRDGNLPQSSSAPHPPEVATSTSGEASDNKMGYAAEIGQLQSTSDMNNLEPFWLDVESGMWIPRPPDSWLPFEVQEDDDVAMHGVDEY